MDFKQLRSFVTVADCGSFTRAAAQLYTSQPTVSAHIRQLEEELQERLFLRTTKTLSITPHGRELYEYAAQLLTLQERMLSGRLHDLQTISLGVSTIPSAYILPELLPAFRTEHPNATFDIHQSDSAGILRGLREGRFELGLIGMAESDESIDFLPFYRDTMVLIAPVDAFSPDSDVLTLIRSHPLLLREAGSGSQKCVDDFFHAAGLEPTQLHVTARLNDQESIKNLVMAGLGLAIVSKKAVQRECARGELLAFSLPNDAATRELYLAVCRGNYLRPQTRSFYEFAAAFYPQ